MISASTAHLKLVHGQRDVDLQRKREDEDEFRQRMKVNLAAAIVLLGVLAIGFWLVDAMVGTQKVHGCYTSGAHSCSLF
jgi:hypothetical protein